MAPPLNALKYKKAASTKGKSAVSWVKADKKYKKGSDHSSKSKNTIQAKDFMKPIVQNVYPNKVYTLLFTELCICKHILTAKQELKLILTYIIVL